MSLESALKEACDGLKSNRATERKKNGEILKDFLSRNAVPALLNDNTHNSVGYTWTEIFDDINDYVMKELEKYETSKTFENVVRPLLSSLLNLCLSGAKKGGAYIKCEKVMDACLIILRDNRLATGIGDAYLNVLLRHILPCQHYLGFITPATWDELLKVCLTTCLKNISKLDDFTKLRLILLVMRNAQNNCQFVVCLRDSLQRVKKCFLRLENDKKVQEVIMDITIFFLESLSAECRLTMCHFTEDILTLVLKFYSQSTDRKKKGLLFKLLHRVIALHHPKGKTQNEEGSLAKNWEIWNKHLNSILEIVCLEIVNWQKNRKQNEMALKDNDDFYILAATVYFQIFSVTDIEINDEGNPSKKPKLSFNKHKTFNDIIDELQQSYLPWLGIVNIYIKEFGNSLSEAEFLSLLAYIETVVSKNPNDYCWNVFHDFSIYVLNISRQYMKLTNETALTSLWNSCVRNSSLDNIVHNTIHEIMQILLTLDFLDYSKVRSLMKLYYDKGMPATNSSIKTWNIIFGKFFSKCSPNHLRIQLFEWLISGELFHIKVTCIKDYLSRLLSKGNINLVGNEIKPFAPDSLYNILFNSVENFILFSEFDYEIPNYVHNKAKVEDPVELNIEIDQLVQTYLANKLTECINKLEKKEMNLLEYVKFINIIVIYLDIVSKCDDETRSDMKNVEIYSMFKHALKIMCQQLNLTLQSEAQIEAKTKLVVSVSKLLMTNFDRTLNLVLRSCLNEDFFKCINHLLTKACNYEDIDLNVENEDDININTLKHNCLYLLAAFCRCNCNYRDDILDLILDAKCYNFKFDVQCALNCVEMLLDTDVEEPPLDMIVSLMQNMCKYLYRDSDASYGILKILSKVIKHINHLDETKKQNIYIMIKSYFLRCKNMYYPPKVAGLIYECCIEIAAMNRQNKSNFDDTTIFVETIIEKIKENTQSIRLYSAYLLKAVFEDYGEANVEDFQKKLYDIFLVDVSGISEVILKDEAANRTLTVLHAFKALVETKPNLILKHVIRILHMQKEKSFDVILVKKVLNIMVATTHEQDIQTYLNRNVISVLTYWFSNNMRIEDLPIYLFGCEDLKCFIDKHLNCLLPADIIWCKKGSITDSEILKQAILSTNKSKEVIIQECFNHMIVLCMPYKVTEKYKLDYTGFESLSTFVRSTEYANKMFQQSCQILKSDTWNSLYVDGFGELVMFSALNLCDPDETEKRFKVIVQGNPKHYYHTSLVFSSILNFLGECIGSDIMKYLCQNQSMKVFKTLFKLWQNVEVEKVFQLKVLSLNSFITFVDSIPLGYNSDAVICNFICKGFVESIKECGNRNEIKIYVQGLKYVLEKVLPDKMDFVRKIIGQLLPILILKKEEGFGPECVMLLDYLLVDMKDYLNESLDVADFVRSLSQGNIRNVQDSSLSTFIDKLKTYKNSLSCPSLETLLSMREFLKVNKGFINILYRNLDSKGFSESCSTSLIHQTIYLLNNILKLSTDKKIIPEACNCLSELGTYDLKSLVTVPPPEVEKIVEDNPNLYFINIVIKRLTEVLFTEDSTVTYKISQALNSFLRYCEDIDILDIENLDKEILKSLLPNKRRLPIEFKINVSNFDDYSSKYENGIFVALVNENASNDELRNEYDWLKIVTSALLQLFHSSSDCLKMLIHVCVLNASLCEKLLPALIGQLLYCFSENQTRIFSDHINNFFSKVWGETFDNRFNSISNSPERKNNTIASKNCNKKIIHIMLKVVDFLRLQKKYYKQRPGRRVECYNYLDLDYAKVAWAASVANQHFDALYYGELWTLSLNDGVPPTSPEATANLPGGEDILQLFRRCYVSIGELDALDGCGTAHLTIEREKRDHLINTSQFSDALLLHDIALSYEENKDPSLQFGVIRSLHKSGMHHLALQYIKLLPEFDELNEIKYECLSYLGDWSDFIDVKEIKEKVKTVNCDNNYILKALHYVCLKDSFNSAVTLNFNKKMEETLNEAKLAVARLCTNINMENCQNVYKVVGKLHLLTDVESFNSVKRGTVSIVQILQQWRIDNLPPHRDFKHLEVLISQRVLILENLAKFHEDYKKSIMSLQLQYAKLALYNDRIHMAQRLLAIAKKLHSSQEVILVDSEIAWAKGQKDIALSLVRNILKSEDIDVNLTAISLRKYALWIAESKRDNPREIINKYLLKSLSMLNDSENDSTKLKLYNDIAQFADAEYKQVVTYMKSSVFEHKVKCMENMKGTASTLKSTQQSLTRDERKAMFVTDRFGDLDEAEIANTKIEKETYLHLAMLYYLLSLKLCEENNLSIFRVISLWLENPCFEFESESEYKYKDLLDEIPSRKFINVLPQLVPHLSKEKSDFAFTLTSIIRRCALEHPHHTLPIVFSLKNSEKDKLILNESSSIGRVNQKARIQEPRVAAAEALVRELHTSKLATIIYQMEDMCDAIISFANYKPQNKNSKQSIPSAEKISKLRNLDAIPVPTAVLVIKNNCDYNDIFSIQYFDGHFELVGGINCPKKIFCTDSSGNKKILLVKGEDDLRQDAVMQQVFNIVNTLLEKNPITSRNNLIIRTYKVVPVSRQSGVLEWCTGTIPLGVYLTGTSNNGAHARYRPQDITCSAARMRLTECHQAKVKTTNKEKLIVFNKILSEFKPVFHYFFTEHYLNPVTWYERRLAYTKSVATSSMVGYILGLGDRHVQNILIDKLTAEVIHIDFGIAFDQGKTLHTPETVPFRLTQDMIAGFGPSGVEGLFQRCCEKTMRLLRDNQETLLTILEVLLCDPLYSWRVATTQQNESTSNKNASMNYMGGGSRSSLAQRALLSVSGKLSGAEEGGRGGVAVPGQVARLLRTAADPANLCRLFPGWQPYL